MRLDVERELRWENMLKGIHAQVMWLERGPREVLADLRAAVAGPPPPCVYLVGCGDSHYAGLAVRHAFEAWSGITTQALPSLQFSRYDVEHAPSGSLVVCVSNSGRVARTIEAAVAGRRRGLRAIAVTYAADSGLANAADATVSYRYPDPGFAPGTVSYLASLTVLYALALRAGELAGALSAAQAEERVDVLTAQAGAAASTIEAADGPAAALAAEPALDTPIRILGGGPSYGTALFGRAKLIEAARIPAEACELEEWAHEEFFCTGPGSLTLVLAPDGASTDRAREQLQAVRDVGGTAVAVCPPGAPAGVEAGRLLPVAGDQPEELSPLTYAIPLELFAFHFASTRGLTMLGFDDEHRREVNFRQIFGSRITTG
jgi:glucosamine--fructose-6-phosphate aminotransferase (isomerizing)